MEALNQVTTIAAANADQADAAGALPSAASG